MLADKNNVFIELMAIEPVQGEGNPGQCITREFYDEARKLTNEHGSLLLIDSIQAGFRGQGCLSVIDYEGFEDCEAPDLETWSKALNAGQYPLSVLGMNSKASELYLRLPSQRHKIRVVLVFIVVGLSFCFAIAID